MLVIAVMAVALCQGPMTFESGVAMFESGDEWVVGPSEACMPHTVLSPDGSARGKERVRVRREEGKGIGVVSQRVSGTSPSLKDTCDSPYQSKSVDITFGNDEKGLTKEHRGLLAALALEKPEFLLVRRYVEKGRNTSETGDLRVVAVRQYLESILATRPSFTEESRTAGDREAPKQIGVTAIYRTGCQEVRRVGSAVKVKEQIKEGVVSK